MAGYIEGTDRSQAALFPECLDDWISDDHLVRVVDLFVEELDFQALRFQRAMPARTGRPGYHPSVLLKLFIYGYLNRTPSSRRLEREAGRNVELMWLTGRLAPDHKTIADFRRDNGPAICRVCARFVELCRRIGVLRGACVAIDGSKFKAVNNRDRRADAEAICEAVSRPSMRFVPVKSEETQALLMTHKAREFLVRQQTQIVNAMCAHLGEFGIVVAKGIHNVERLIAALEAADLPAPARKALNLLADQLVDTRRKIETLTADIRADARSNEAARRLQSIPGIGPITASALVSALPDISDFGSGRDLSAWLGLTPKPHSSGGKERLGRISKMGNRYLRRLLYLGATAQIRVNRAGFAGGWRSSRFSRSKAFIFSVISLGISTRSVDDLVKAMGAGGMSKSQCCDPRCSSS